MPRFSTISIQRLETVHPELSMLFQAVVKHRDCHILCGVRSKAEQDRLYNLGRTKMMWPNSRHNVRDPNDLAMAVDVAPFFVNRDPQIIWPRAGSREYIQDVGLYYNFAGYVQAIADSIGIRVRWGGDWDGDLNYSDQTFNDLVHWEIKGV